MEYDVPQSHRFSSRFENMPLDPLLSPDEVRNETGKLIDLRGTLPPKLQAELGPDDIVIRIVTPSIDSAERKPSAIRELIRLTGAHSTRDVGHHGGPVASLAGEHNSEVKALRKFEALHGRDALEISVKLMDQFPELLRTTLVSLAETQGQKDREYQPGQLFNMEEPGRILLVDRPHDDPVGQKFSAALNWDWPFYGSIDATPSFISAITRYTSEHDTTFIDATYIGRDGEAHTIGEALALSTDWLTRKLDASQVGLLEFKNTDESGGGIDAQAWKDSAFAYIHADGSRANHDAGIASVEVQALTYDALLDAAVVFRSQDLPDQASELEDRAATLRQKIIDIFWKDDPKKGGYFALATDHDPENGELRTLDVRTSNMGHLLNSRLLEGDDEQTRHMRDSTVRQLFTDGLLQYSGIRTFANDEIGFREGGYHTGSVWLWDTAYIADGLERHNFHQLAWDLRERIWRTVQETGSFPEFVRGGNTQSVETSPSEIYVLSTKYNRTHLFEQPPQEIQGWTVSATLAAKYAHPAYLRNKAKLPVNELEQSILASIN